MLTKRSARQMSTVRRKVWQSKLGPDELKLYRLIWQRFVASQMMPAVFDQTTIDIKAGRFTFRATGSVQKFDGFLKVYQEGRDEKPADDEDDENRALPMVQQGETLKLNSITPEQHFTEPPPRYSEATLVKALGRERHRPPVNVCGDHDHHPGPRVCREDRKSLPSDPAWV